MLLSSCVDVFAEAPVAADSTDVERRELLGDMYAEIVKDHDMFMMIMRLFMMGSDPRFGQLSRDSFARVYRVLREDVGMDAEQARLFLSHGLLMNLVLSLRLWEGERVLSDEILGFLGKGRAEAMYSLHDAPGSSNDEGSTVPRR